MDVISELHLLEQVASEQNIGTLAENLLETMSEHPPCYAEVSSLHELINGRNRSSLLLVTFDPADQGGAQGHARGEEEEGDGHEEQGAGGSGDAGQRERTGDSAVCSPVRDGEPADRGVRAQMLYLPRGL